MATTKTRILLRNASKEAWESSQLVLLKGEVGIDTTTGLVRMGQGKNGSIWQNSLPLGPTASQISGIIGDYSKEYQLTAVTGETNSWQLQSKTINGTTWTDVVGQKFTVDFSAINSDITYLSNLISATKVDLSDLSNALWQEGDQRASADNEISAVVDTKLAISAFYDLSNEIGLSAATTSNTVVTQKDIASITGAMHFRGVVASLADITDPQPGDVAIVGTSEYVYGGDPAEWKLFGDEGIYATKAEVETISTGLTSDIAGLTADVDYLSGQIDATNTTLNTVSSDYLKAADKTELQTLVGTTSAETLVSANAYTDTKFAGLSDYYTKAEVNAISTALSTDYQGKIDGLTADVEYISGQVSSIADRYATKDYVNTVSASLSSDYVSKIDTAASNTLTAANKYTDDEIAKLSIDNYIKHGEVVQSDLSGFFILDCGSATLREGEPTSV